MVDAFTIAGFCLAKTHSGKPLQLVVFCEHCDGYFHNKRGGYMKRYGNLFEQICSPENVTVALYKAARNKHSKHSVMKTLGRKDEAIAEIVDLLKTETYQTAPYHKKIVYEPKMRTIYSLPFFPDRIVHHALMNVLEPIWDAQLDSSVHSSRTGKGCYSGSRQCMGFIRKYRYFLKADILHFYQNIDHQVCKNIIRKKIKDKHVLKILDGIIDSANNIPGAVIGKNAPIGNLPSQWIGNLYLNELDLWLRHVCHAHAYIRYCDDFVIFANDKAFLNDIKTRLPDFLESHLKLALSKITVAPVSRGIDFLGYRHFPRFVLLRKRNARKVKAFIHGVKNGTILHDRHSQGIAASYHGLLKHSNSYNFRQSLGFDEIYLKYKEAPQDEAV